MDFLTSTRVEMLLKYWQLPVAVAYPNMSGSEETEPPNLKPLVLSAFWGLIAHVGSNKPAQPLSTELDPRPRGDSPSSSPWTNSAPPFDLHYRWRPGVRASQNLPIEKLVLGEKAGTKWLVGVNIIHAFVDHPIQTFFGHTCRNSFEHYTVTIKYIYIYNMI